MAVVETAFSRAELVIIPFNPGEMASCKIVRIEFLSDDNTLNRLDILSASILANAKPVLFLHPDGVLRAYCENEDFHVARDGAIFEK